MAETPESTAAAAPPARRRGGAMRGLRYLAIAVIACVALAYGAREVWDRFTHVHEYDARIKANMVTLASKVEGVILELAVDEGDRVERGQVLARLDDRIPKLRVQGLEAELAGLEAERRRLLVERGVMDAQTSTRMLSRESDVRASKAGRSVLLTDLDLARSELRRAKALYERRVVSKHALDQANAKVDRIEADLAKGRCRDPVRTRPDGRGGGRASAPRSDRFRTRHAGPPRRQADGRAGPAAGRCGRPAAARAQ